MLHSVHIPFANDTESKIETWILPLGGIHVRIHKVSLANRYYVCEGGFALPRLDDYLPKTIGGDFMYIQNHPYFSGMKTVTSEKIGFSVSAAQAGFHLYAPLSACPMYCTKSPLDKGEYVFASAFYVSRHIIENSCLPQMQIKQYSVEIEYKKQNLEIDL